MVSAVTIRPARPTDLPAITSIYNHYIENTVALFALQTRSTEETLERFNAIRDKGLPYIVASSIPDESTSSEADEIQGFCLVAPFRGHLAGYRHTVELSLFCNPKSRSQGLGSAMLVKMIDILRLPERYDESWISADWKDDGRVISVIAVMALDETASKSGWGLKEWYEKRGFEMCGRFRKVGRKFNRCGSAVYFMRIMLYVLTSLARPLTGLGEFERGTTAKAVDGDRSYTFSLICTLSTLLNTLGRSSVNFDPDGREDQEAIDSTSSERE